MPKLKNGSIAFASVLASLFILSPAAATLPTIPASGRVALGAFLNQTIADNLVPAVSVVIVNREQQLLLEAVGKRDAAKHVPLTSDSIFRIASMTKPITSLAVMMLHEEGKIGFDDPVTKYLPEFERVRVMTSFNDADRTFESRPPARPITVRHLVFLNGGRAGGTRLVSEASLRLMTSDQIGPLVVQEQPSANTMLARPFPFGGGKDTFGFGFQIETAPSSLRNADRGLRSEGSYSWGGINNTHFWIDPQQQIGVAVLMQVLPYYDEAAIKVLRGVERLVYQHLRVGS